MFRVQTETKVRCTMQLHCVQRGVCQCRTRQIPKVNNAWGGV